MSTTDTNKTTGQATADGFAMAFAAGGPASTR